MVANNGTLSIQGLQFDTTNGQSFVGPFSIPFSAISSIAIVPFNSSNVATPVPTGVQGVVITPNGTSGMTVSMGFITAQVSRISPIYPTVVTFDQASLPTNIYLTISNTANAAVTLQFF